MLARRELPPDYHEWNRAWGAPGGRHRSMVGAVTKVAPSSRRFVRHDPRIIRSRGPFAYQPNTSTRAVEYPWTHEQLAAVGPSRVLEIGGALSGMQFVLAQEGYDVHNVDPFFDYGSGEYGIDPGAEHDLLNRSFGTEVVLHRSTLPEAGLSGPFAAAFCVSTIEHLSPGDIEATLGAVKDLLAPGGLLVLTIDLFLNLEPFCSRTTNQWGGNTSVAWIDEILGFSMVAGDRRELNGYDEFSRDDILGRLEEFAISSLYPQMAQLVTFRAPGG